MIHENARLKEALRRTNIPDHMHDGILLWVDYGYRPGHFLTAVIENNLAEAVNRADEQSAALLADYVRFFYNYAPALCWGSPEKARAWAEARRAERLAV